MSRKDGPRNLAALAFLEGSSASCTDAAKLGWSLEPADEEHSGMESLELRGIPLWQAVGKKAPN